MITEYERVKAIEHSDEIAVTILENTEGQLYYKIFSNFIAKAYPNKRLHFDETAFKDNKAMANNMGKMIKYMVQIASEGISIKNYTTGQLSKYFGVSVTSINNWIKEGRFTRVDREAPKKQARIPENAEWRSANGELIPVKEIIETWEKHYAERQKLSKEDEREALVNEIKFLEERYGGKYEDTLLVKENKTDVELQDQQDWKYLLKRLAEE